MVFKWIGGATWILTVNGVKIACDPVLCPKGSVQDYKYFKSRRLEAPVYNESDFSGVDLWLLTHNHEDHLDASGREKIKNSIVIGDRSVYKKFKNMTVLDWKEKKQIFIKNTEIIIKAVPAYHAGIKAFSYLVGNGNGYLLALKYENRQYDIYISGDGVFFNGMKKYLKKDIDLAIINAGSAGVGSGFLSKIIGRITNNTEDIIRLNNIIKPKMIIPVHWGTFTHYKEKLKQESFYGREEIILLKPGNEIEI